MMPDINQQCHGKWPSLLALVGIDSKALQNKHGPCPICGGKDRFRFDNQEGRGTSFCGQCGARSGMDLAMAATRLPFRECAALLREQLGIAVETPSTPPRSEEKGRQRASELWQGAVPVFDDEAARYLRGRGFSAPFSNQLRFHHGAYVSDHPTRRYLPALLGRVCAPDGTGAAIHRTYLAEGGKAIWSVNGVPASPRRVLGKIPDGAAIRLRPATSELAIAEGIETALAVARDFSLACWSVLNAGNMRKFVPPTEVTELHIFADNDENFVGQEAATGLARTLRQARPDLTVTVRIPDRPGTDWADPQPMEKAA